MMRVADRIAVSPARAVTGVLRVPGDKSISHRYALLAAIADGPSTISNYAPGADCASTLACLASLGAIVSRTPAPDDGGSANRHHRGPGPARPAAPPPRPLDCGNSGSTMRMLGGVIAAHPFISTLVGDASLSRRPMRRIIGPLTQMGATVTAGPGDRPPVVIHGARPHRHPLRARHAERPGQVRGAAGRTPGDRRDPRDRAGLYPGSYGTRAGGVRRDGDRRTADPSPCAAANAWRDARCACPATSRRRRSWPWRHRRWPGRT